MVFLDVCILLVRIGQLLADWRANSNIPVGVPAFFVVLFVLKLKGLDHTDRSLSIKVKLLHMDVAGAAIFISAICCLLLALQWGGTTRPWKSSTIIGLLVGFMLLIIIFIVLEWRQKEKATIPLRFLKQRSLLMGACFATLIYASNYLVGSEIVALSGP